LQRGFIPVGCLQSADLCPLNKYISSQPSCPPYILITQNHELELRLRLGLVTINQTNPKILSPEPSSTIKNKMCFKAACPTCSMPTIYQKMRELTLTSPGKLSWSGCGSHVPGVMDQIPLVERCTCEPKVISSSFFLLHFL